MKRTSGRAPWLLLFVLAFVLVALHWLVRYDRYYAGGEETYVEIPRGTSSWQVGERLAAAGVLRHPLLYQLAHLIRPGRGAKAGEYRFTRPATPAEVFARLAAGDVYLIEIRVPEGSTRFDIAAQVQQSGLASAEEFLAATRSTELIRDLAPGAPSLEGFLFPATYRLRRRTPPKEICRAMVERFRREWIELHPRGNSAMTLVTLASIVEKEAVLDSERARIAGVYAARLRKGMKLDCDPTVIYAAQLDRQWTGVIRRADLDSDNRYNTYRYAGLPPGPIASPGRASLVAALRPVETDDLYFVAAPGGGGAHVFSKDFAAHEQAVASYRRGQRKLHSARQ
jgi:UPF0755 protein